MNEKDKESLMQLHEWGMEQLLRMKVEEIADAMKWLPAGKTVILPMNTLFMETKILKELSAKISIDEDTTSGYVENFKISFGGEFIGKNKVLIKNLG